MVKSAVRCLPKTVCVLLATMSWNAVRAGDFEGDPIRYTQAQPDNIVSRLNAKLLSGDVKLERSPRFGYLPAVLDALGVSPESQMLVFSKTSFQRQKIAPRTPRAIYFNDDVYVGYCHLGDVLEITAVDANLGAVFYSMDQDPDETLQFMRQTDSCLICHGGSMTQGVPGHVVRSVYPTSSGEPSYSMGTFRITHSSPLEKRWGGWYVTGTHGAQKHLGNLIVKARVENHEVDNAAGQNLKSVSNRFNPDSYLRETSDIVALMVMEHQAELQNLLTKASFETRKALHYDAALRGELSDDRTEWLDSTKRRIGSASDELLKYLLFSDEVRLTDEIQGSPAFVAEFESRGPTDSQGRSLRQFDLKTRLFRYPCSYLIYSDAFQNLPPAQADAVWKGLDAILRDDPMAMRIPHLTAADRTAIREILLATHPVAAARWGGSTASK